MIYFSRTLLWIYWQIKLKYHLIPLILQDKSVLNKDNDHHSYSLKYSNHASCANIPNWYMLIFNMTREREKKTDLWFILIVLICIIHSFSFIAMQIKKNQYSYCNHHECTLTIWYMKSTWSYTCTFIKVDEVTKSAHILEAKKKRKFFCTNWCTFCAGREKSNQWRIIFKYKCIYMYI